MTDATININELKTMLKRLVWDYNIPEGELVEIFWHDKKGHALNRDQLRARLLNTYNWYVLVNFFGRDFVKELLEDNVTSYLFPRSLKDKYVRIGQILST